MARNGSGTYSLPAGNPVVSGAAISSTTHNSTMSDIATALTQSLASDGQTVPTADLPMGAYKHSNVGNATARANYAAAGQVQDSSLTWAGTAGGTADAITLTLTPAITAYAAGQSFTYKSGASANTTTMTVNVNSVGAKAIQKNGSALAAGDHPANNWFRITYDGAAFQLEQISPMALKANVASPTFTGTPAAPTAATGTNTTQIATTAFVLAQIKNVPLFNAYAASSQSVTSGVAAKVTLGTKVRDTDSCFASSRFTAATAGDYFFRGSVRGVSTTLTSIEAYLYKNGSPYRVVNQVFPSQSSSRQVEVSDTIYLGVGDYVELWAIVIGGTPSFEYISSYATSSLCGYLVRMA